MNSSYATALAGARQLVANATQVAVLTGAGMSQESGMPTFRDAQTGWWERYQPEELASPKGWRADKALVYAWYCTRAATVRRSLPNRGHQALAAFQRHQPSTRVITQNVDDLHERAGTSDVIHLHGQLNRLRCFACRREGGPLTLPELEGACFRERIEPPRCRHCGGYLRPDVVWFGEVLPEGSWQEALEVVQTCDLLVIVGTSLQVQPASTLPTLAARHGAKLIEVNPDPDGDPYPPRVRLTATAAKALPDLLPS